MANTTKRDSTRDADQTLRGAYNDVDATISVNGFLTGKIGHRVTAASIDYTIVIDADSDLYENGTIDVVQKASGWVASRDFTGDETFIDLDIDSSGQVIYSSPSYTGFVSGKIVFRSIGLGV